MFFADSSFPVVRDKKTPIGSRELYPHYTDRRFVLPTRHRTVFLAPGAVILDNDQGFDRVEGVDSYEHSRQVLVGHNNAWETVRQTRGGRDEKYERTAAFFEALLGQVLDQPLEIMHILTAVNVGGNGNAYQDFGVKFLEQQA